MQEQQEVSQGSPHKERSSEPWLANSSVGATRASSVFTGVACGNTGHRVETCGTAAAQLIRQLRSKLADALQTKSRKERQATTCTGGWEPPRLCPCSVHWHRRAEDGPGETGSRLGAAQMLREVRGGLAEAVGVRGCG